MLNAFLCLALIATILVVGWYTWGIWIAERFPVKHWIDRYISTVALIAPVIIFAFAGDPLFTLFGFLYPGGLWFTWNYYQEWLVDHGNSTLKERIDQKLRESEQEQLARQQAHLAHFVPAEELVARWVEWIKARCDQEELLHPAPHIWEHIQNIIRQVYSDSFLNIYQGPYVHQRTHKRVETALKNRETNPDFAYNLFAKHLCEALMIYIRELPGTPQGIISLPLYDIIDSKRVGYAMLSELYDQTDHDFFPMPKLWEVLNENYWRVTRAQLPPEDVQRGKAIWPATFQGSAREFVIAYFQDTPLLPLFQELAPIDITPRRLEHQFILAPSGSGKTQLLQWMIAEDIKKVLSDEVALVIIDSQGVSRRKTDKPTLIDNIISLAAVRERLVYIKPDPNLALNIFDTGYRDEGLTDEEREIRATAAREMVATALGSTSDLQFQMLLWCIRLTMLTDNPSLGILRRVLTTSAKDFPEVFGEALGRATEATREYFASFHTGPRNATKESLVTRVDGMRSNDIFSAMVEAPENECQMIELVEASNVVVIDADKSRLGDYGAEAFGRFFVAQLLYATRQRQSTKPVYIFVDEAHDFVSNDDNIARLLTQARKQDVGLILACPNISLINSTKVRDTLQDVAIVTRATEHANAGTFDFSIRGITKGTPVQVNVPYGVMEDMERISDEELADIRAPYPELPKPTPPPLEATPEPLKDDDEEEGVIR